MMVAMALACNPSVLIADEPVTALDVTIQAQILDLIKELRDRTGASVLLITHDMGVVAETCDRVAVMYLGKIVEMGPLASIFETPKHPYTVGLFASIPRLEETVEWLQPIPGTVPSPLNLPTGCRFFSRCPHAMPRCAEMEPPTVETAASTSGGLFPLRVGRPGMSVPLLETRGLVKHFPVEGTREIVHAVDDVDLAVAKGETLGLVGESGCGKTTVGRLVLRLVEATAGELLLDGRDLARISTGELRRLRARMQIVFQDPFSSLNPRMTVQTLLDRPMQLHLNLSAAARAARVGDLLEKVGLQREHRSRYPHEFSGGQRQRIAVARALSVNPDFIVLDEPTSALDVSVQAQILNLLKRLQRDHGLTFLFISHNLSVVRHMSDRIAVMYLGQLVEVATRETLFTAPLHPYTRALISAIPALTPQARRERIRLAGDVPSAIRVPAGCRFHTRCPFAEARCLREPAALRQVAAPGKEPHQVRCHLVP